MAEDDFEIKEPGEYMGKKEEVYSHSLLLMAALKQCRESRAKEMRDGYWNTKFDRMGNAHRVWIPDSRKEFIESVEALMMLQERDYDDTATKDIEDIKEELKKKYKEYCNKEEQEWIKMHPDRKQKLMKEGAVFREGLLSEYLVYVYEYTRDMVEDYTKIVSTIQKLIKRIGEYQEEYFEA